MFAIETCPHSLVYGCHAELAKLDLVDIDTSMVESNIVLWHLKPEAPPVAAVLARLKDADFIVGGMKGEQSGSKGYTAAGVVMGWVLANHACIAQLVGSCFLGG
jgi:hypothetical protein